METNAQTPEAVALKLLELVAVAEGKALDVAGAKVSRKWILETYAECLSATKPSAKRKP